MLTIVTVSMRYLGIFYVLFTIVMKVLAVCTENPIIFIEILDELRLVIDNTVILIEKCDTKTFNTSKRYAA
jgi:hypothetical protein